ncbi:DEAD/DEAH box helicase [Gleimia hominis]|uniref:DEAD/DEAH box helicase n=1 Tax=Gleimia hominis TaxID=595468 RepID=UPI0018ECB0AF|nr:DEAD/DEAH box helicase [Gleimia hominis]WIK64027.1 DEAD/DEAH box helicase [Gleimia hominis]
MAAAEQRPGRDDILQVLTRIAAGSDRLITAIHVPQRDGQAQPWPTWVHPKVRNRFETRGIAKPWAHQVKGMDAVWNGRHTVVATGTGSGKSMVAWAPILSAVEQGDSTRLSALHARPSALYLAPTKALAADQMHSLHALAGNQLAARIGLADGDTAAEAKDWARAQADIVLTNPDYLHHVLLPGHERWTRLLARLRYIVVDEMHYWRGVLGSHIAMVLRRLLRLARHLGAQPVVVFLSATVAEPADAAARLIGVSSDQITCVDEDTSPAGSHDLVLWQGAQQMLDEVPIEEYLRAVAAAQDGTGVMRGEFQRRSATSEAAVLVSALVERGVRLLAFVRSRGAAETLAAQAGEQLAARGCGFQVAAYRGGFLPEERRELEQSLRTGSLRALATTNALELGIDISGLDATITAGWPGTRASMWQQVGRAGRSGDAGVSVLIASDNPLDSFLVHHPQMLLEQVEASTFDPANPFVLGPHLCAAAAELALTPADAQLFGLPDVSYFEQLAAHGYLRRRPAGWFWNVALPMRPSDLTDIRGSAGEVQVVDESTGSVIGTVNADQAHSQVHPGAIYVHQGRTYQVSELTRVPATPGASGSSAGTGGGRVALVNPVTTRLRTRPTVHQSVEILSEADSWVSADGAVRWCVGDVEVTSQVTDFDTLRLPGLQFVTNTALALPADTLRTVAVWWEIDSEAVRAAGVADRALPGALHAAEHASIGILPLLATCDRWDLGGLSTAEHEQTHAPTVFVHDGYPGGAGFANHGWLHARQWVEATLDVVATCECEAGCPRCIQSPKCGNGNEPLSKPGALALLRFLVQHCPE